jgi:hypothetical protein
MGTFIFYGIHYVFTLIVDVNVSHNLDEGSQVGQTGLLSSPFSSREHSREH